MKKKYTAVLGWFNKNWRLILSIVVIVGIAFVVAGLEINTIVDGQNKYETIALKEIEQKPSVFHRSVNYPFNITAYSIGQVVNSPLKGARITSAIFGLIATICFFFLIRSWFNPRIATASTVLFVTSSWLLAITHMAVPLSAMVLAPLIALLPLSLFLRTKKHRLLFFVLFAIALGVSAYTPMMAWIILITLLTLVIKEKNKLLSLKSWQILLSAFIFLFLLIPMFISLSFHAGQIREYLGLPLVYPTFLQYLHNLLDLIMMIVVHSSPMAELHIDHLAMLDFFSAAMFILGLIYFAMRIKTRRSIILFGILSVLILIIPISNLYQLHAAILIPFVYICIAAGIVELINQWFAYFPRNPWARQVGVILVVIAIGFSCFYHLNRYFIAWPNTPETKAVYVVKSK